MQRSRVDVLNSQPLAYDTSLSRRETEFLRLAKECHDLQRLVRASLKVGMKRWHRPIRRRRGAQQPRPNPVGFLHLLSTRTLGGRRQSEVCEGTPDGRSLRVFETGHRVDFAIALTFSRPASRGGLCIRRVSEHRRHDNHVALGSRDQSGDDAPIRKSIIEQANAVSDRGVLVVCERELGLLGTLSPSAGDKSVPNKHRSQAETRQLQRGLYA